MARDERNFNAPATKERIESLLSRLEITESSRVLDVGCGRGRMLRMLVEANGCSGIGVDPDEAELEVARLRTPSTLRLEWLADEISNCDFGREFDGTICVGATHAFGPPGQGLLLTLEGMGRYLRVGGRLLVGEGYWKQAPPTEYLAATPFEEKDLLEHAANEALGEAAGWALVHSEVSSLEEWDAFESSFLREAEARSAAEPDDHEASRQLEHWRSWNNAYRQWGRDTLGFGFYIFEMR